MRKAGGKATGLDVLGGLLGGLGDLVRRLDEVSEDVERSGSFERDGVQGVYGVNVKVGLGRDGSRDVVVEPIGGAPRGRGSGSTTVSGVREPLVDVLDEADHLLVIAEMPGIQLQDVTIRVEGDILTLEAKGEERHYRREVLLPSEPGRGEPRITLNNGIVEIRLPR